MSVNNNCTTDKRKENDPLIALSSDEAYRSEERKSK